MLKTKLGISIAFLGAATYFLVAYTGISSWVTLLIVAYVLYAEENEWLKKTVVKAVAVSLFFSILYFVVGWFDNVASIINIIIHWFDKTADYFEIPARLTDLFRQIISLASDVILVLLGVFALKMKTIKVPVVDALIDKYVGNSNN